MKVRIKPPSIQAEDNGIKPISPSLGQIVGPSHKKGGVDVTYGNKTVEAQGSEPVSVLGDGSLVFFGKLKDPGTKKTFETQAKQIAQQENTDMRMSNKGNDLISDNNPYITYESLKFNSGVVLADAANQRLAQDRQEIESLANRQQIELWKKDNKNKGKAQSGLNLSWTQGPEIPVYQLPQPVPQPIPETPIEAVQPTAQGTLAQRNNNPGNLKFNNQPGATKGDAGFARFESYEAGRQALINDLKAKQTGKTRTKLGPNSTLLDLMKVYSPASDNNDPDRLAQTLAKGLGVTVGTKIGGLDTEKLADLVAINEDAAYARSKGTTPPVVSNTPVSTPTEEAPLPRRRDVVTPIESITELQPITVNPPQGVELNRQQYNRVNAAPQVQQPRQSSPRNTLTPLDYLPEIAAIFDRPDYVQGQQYNPQLLQDYNVSLQDQINQNTASFNALSRSLANNPEALATLAAQRYQQNQGVLGQEFRINQQIANEVANQNNQILNQAQLTNIQLADTQMVRQDQARANTEAARNAALTSISNKYAMNKATNNALDQIDQRTRIMENFFNYRLDPQGNYNYQGPDAQWMMPIQNQGQALTPRQQEELAKAEKLREQAEAIRLKNAQSQANYKFGGKLKHLKSK